VDVVERAHVDRHHVRARGRRAIPAVAVLEGRDVENVADDPRVGDFSTHGEAAAFDHVRWVAGVEGDHVARLEVRPAFRVLVVAVVGVPVVERDHDAVAHVHLEGGRHDLVSAESSQSIAHGDVDHREAAVA
jgi:hypothetical protein